MADFQNVGTFDAGVFTPKLGGIAPSGSSLPWTRQALLPAVHS